MQWMETRRLMQTRISSSSSSLIQLETTSSWLSVHWLWSLPPLVLSVTCLSSVSPTTKKRSRWEPGLQLWTFSSEAWRCPMCWAVWSEPRSWSLTKWSCSISRLFQTVFVFITNYNLVVIAVERYICTCRPTSRPLSSRTVREAVKVTWLLGFLFSLGFSYSIDAVRVDLNSTHYTLLCEYDFTTTVGIISQQVRALLTYIIPIIIQTFTCVSIWRMLCTRQQQATGAQNNSEAIRKWNIRRKKATIELLDIIMAYTIPCSMFFIWSVLRSIFAQLSLEFKTDYTIRLVAVLFVYLNGCVNFVIHLAQLVGFRKAMQGYLSYLRCCKCECKTAGQTRTMNHTAQKEPKSPPAAVKGDNKRRASMSQVQDAEERQETQTRRHSC